MRGAVVHPVPPGQSVLAVIQIARRDGNRYMCRLQAPIDDAQGKRDGEWHLLQRFRHAFSAPVGARAGSALAGARHVLTVVGCRRARAPFLAWHTPHAESTAPRSAATAKTLGPMHAVRAHVRRLTATPRVPRPDVRPYLLHESSALAQGARPQRRGRERHSAYRKTSRRGTSVAGFSAARRVSSNAVAVATDGRVEERAASSPSVPASSPRVAVEGVTVTFSLARCWQNPRSTSATATAG